MTFTQAVRSGFKNTLDFSGRASRSEFWYWVLFFALCVGFASFLDNFFFHASLDSDLYHSPIYFIVGVTLLLPSIALDIRRLHDIDRTGLWILLYAIPVIGTLVLFIFHIRKGTHGSNQYGDDPLYTDPEAYKRW